MLGFLEICSDRGQPGTEDFRHEVVGAALFEATDLALARAVGQAGTEAVGAGTARERCLAQAQLCEALVFMLYQQLASIVSGEVPLSRLLQSHRQGLALNSV